MACKSHVKASFFTVVTGTLVNCHINVKILCCDACHLLNALMLFSLLNAESNLKSFSSCTRSRIIRSHLILKTSQYHFAPLEHFSLRLRVYLQFLGYLQAEWEAESSVFRPLFCGISSQFGLWRQTASSVKFRLKTFPFDQTYREDWIRWPWILLKLLCNRPRLLGDSHDHSSPFISSVHKLLCI